MTRDEDLTWDIQQDSYLQAFERLDTLENNASFFPWLRRIAVNTTVTQMRKRMPLRFSDLGGDEESAEHRSPAGAVAGPKRNLAAGTGDSRQLTGIAAAHRRHALLRRAQHQRDCGNLEAV